MLPHLKSPDVLLALGAQRRKDSNKLPVRGKKRLEATGCQREKQLIQKKQDQSQATLAEERLVKLSHLSRGHWNDKTLLAEIHCKKGGHWNYFGYSRGDIEVLQPEEAVYLIEIGALELCYKGLPLSLQQAYSTVLTKTFPLYKYQVYCHLLRLGFIVKRHSPTRVKDNNEPQTKVAAESNASVESCIPLVTPVDATTSDNILSKLQIIKSVPIKKVATSTEIDTDDAIDFDVYLPNSNFKKVNFGSPNVTIKVVRYEDPFPSGNCIAKLISSCKPTPLKWALNDNGDITFYSFDEMDIPVINS